MRKKVILVALALGAALATCSNATSASAQGIACGVVHASHSQGVDAFAVRGIGVACALARSTTTVWVINECGSTSAPPGNRVLRRQVRAA